MDSICSATNATQGRIVNLISIRSDTTYRAYLTYKSDSYRLVSRPSRWHHSLYTHPLSGDGFDRTKIARPARPTDSGLARVTLHSRSKLH